MLDTVHVSTRPLARVERFETIVIGAGQAGLATGYELARRDVDFAIVTDEAQVGDQWRRRWDSLRLFTPAKYSGLPGMCFPAPPTHLADKDEVADYLARYAERFELPIRLRTPVELLGWNGERFILRTPHGTLEAENVVVATGAFQRPRIPALAARLDGDIRQLHSSEYRNHWELPEGPALVVGAGNSGAQIALELSRFRKVWLAGRDTGHLPRRAFGRDLFDWIWPVLERGSLDTRLGRRMRARAARGGDALIGIPERELAAAGVRRVSRVTDVRGGLPVCGDDVLQPRVIVWCTGFAHDYRWIELPIFGEDGAPRHERGAVREAPGLFFVGLRFQHRQSSSLIGGVGADAAWVAARVAARVAASEVAV